MKLLLRGAAVLGAAAACLAGPGLAQESAHYKLESGSFNAGGRPSQGVVAQSASYLLSLDAIGDAGIGTGPTSAGFSPGVSMIGGFAGAYRSPGEVRNLRFTDATTLWWDPEPSTGDYALYQGTVGRPFPAGYGICAQPPPAIGANTTTVTAAPALRQALFYLVTARNGLAQEGTKGFSSAGAPHPNPAPCSYVVSAPGTFSVGFNPYGVVSDGSSIWVTNAGSNDVTKLRASDGAVVGTFPVGFSPVGVVFDGSSIWVANYDSSSVSKLRASDGANLGTFPVGINPVGVAFDGFSIWVANFSDNNMTRLRASDGFNMGTFPVGSSPYVVAFDGSSIWVTSSDGNNVTRLRASDGANLGTFPVGTAPLGIAFDGSSIWVTNALSNNVTRLRASDGALLNTFPLGASPRGLVFDGSSMWVANQDNNNVTKLRAFDGANLGTFSVGTSPYGVAFDGAHVWVANVNSNTVTKL